MTPYKTAYTVSRRLAQDLQVAEVLGCPVRYAGGVSRSRASRMVGQDPHRHCVIGWGTKPNTEAGRVFAREHGMPFLALEDGFLGYLGHPAFDNRRLSIITDSSGIYYDSTQTSDLEDLLQNPDWVTPQILAGAELVLERILKIGASKYNHGFDDLPDSVAAASGQKVLVVDQTAGDQSIIKGGASAESFAKMLQAARALYPDATVFLKVHPDVLLGKKVGHFDPRTLDPDIVLIADSVSPQRLIAEMDAVFAVTSQMGFEALLAGKAVHVFGMPFYAGWGLTEDHGPACARRTRTVSLSEFVAAALLEYPTYLDPYLGGQTDIDTVLDYIEAERALPRLTGRRVFPLNFSVWKRTFLPAYLQGASRVTPITDQALKAVKWRRGDAVVAWGRHMDDRLASLPVGVDVWRVEDGFVRSQGLGSDLSRPSSLAFDRTGTYYDATRPSDLETYLRTAEFSYRQLARGARLREEIVGQGVTKYNVGRQAKLDFRTSARGRAVLLVPGQVETDASLAFGSPQIRRNLDLLEAVRAANPDAYIVYKPHPDEVARNRGRSEGEPEAAADETVTDVDILSCFDAVDAVHTMTSLSGFEALLRGVPVTVYGHPFYAGWGLTTDQSPVPRRGRSLSLDALVYALLCVYSRCTAWPQGQPTVPEALIQHFSDVDRQRHAPARSPYGGLGQVMRKVYGLWIGLTR